MARRGHWAALAAAGTILAASACLSQTTPAAGTTAQFTDKGELTFPADYRNWTFLSSGYGMSYNAKANAAAAPPFDNTFVQSEAYRAFLQSGHWPEGAMLVLEVRGSTSQGSINKHGAFQSGDPVGVEVHVHDSKRFKGGWGFFDADPAKPVAMIPYDAACYACHQQHAAVDTTFVQFYPTLLPVAKAKATLSASYLTDEAKPVAP